MRPPLLVVSGFPLDETSEYNLTQPMSGFSHLTLLITRLHNPLGVWHNVLTPRLPNTLQAPACVGWE